MCHQTEIPTPGWIRAQLSDHPLARTYVIGPGGLPVLATTFESHDTKRPLAGVPGVSEIRTIYPYLNSRGFTTSVESPLLDPTEAKALPAP